METLDLDRLHKVFFGELHGRRVGNTVLDAVNIIGISLLPDFNYRDFIVMMPDCGGINYLVNTIEEVCVCMEVAFERTDYSTIDIGCCSVNFKSKLDKSINLSIHRVYYEVLKN